MMHKFDRLSRDAHTWRFHVNECSEIGTLNFPPPLLISLISFIMQNTNRCISILKFVETMIMCILSSPTTKVRWSCYNWASIIFEFYTHSILKLINRD